MDEGEDGSRSLPSVFYNLTTLAGAALAAVSLGLILFLVALEATARGAHPYMGIVAFVLLPPFLLLGIGLAAAGALRESSRRRRGLPASRRLPRIDLNDGRHRRAFAVVAGGGIGLLALSAFGSYQAYEYTESNAFCGTACHVPMHPEYATYRQSPHARVGCVECHIGPGAEWFVRSKLSGAYQVWATLMDRFPRPIPTPIESLRPSRETCEQCHWPAWFAGDALVVRDYFLSDEANTHVRMSLLMKVGGGDPRRGERSGIHWHMVVANRVEYAATDPARLEIPWVRVTDAEGRQKAYVAEGSGFDAARAEAAGIRAMDCLDCHNRPAHAFHHPAEAVNHLLARERIPRALPELKRVAVEALEAGYPSTAAALEGIDARVRRFYIERHPEVTRTRAREIDRAVAALRETYRENYFPRMDASWEDYPEHRGHLWSPGCFRCHDGNHVAEDGSVLSNDCNLCHTLLSQQTGADGDGISLSGTDFRHPVDVGGAWQVMPCTDCHGR